MAKQCFRCKQVLPDSSFYPIRPEKRLQPYCISCHAEYMQEWRDANPTYNRNYHRIFAERHPGYNTMTAMRVRAEARKARQNNPQEAPG
jgi:hypothetical protein